MEEAMSPGDSIFFAPGFEFSIIAIIGGKTKIDAEVIKLGLKTTLLNHPRFTSIVVMNNKKGTQMCWKQTEVNLDDHVIVPDLDPNMDSPDLFVENYISDLTRTHFTDLSKPLWEFHLLDVKTSQATSTGVFKIHHSLGDGASLISLLLACTRKTSDPTALPTVPKMKSHYSSSKKDGMIKRFFLSIWTLLTCTLNTIVDMTLFFATMFFLKDTNTPLKGKDGVVQNPRRFVHQTISFDEMKLVKNALNVTVNDVALGITQAGLARYLARNYEKEEDMNKKRRNFLANIRFRAAITFNIRPTAGIEALADMMDQSSKVKWGNGLGYVILPFNVSLEDDPLNYIHRAKATIDRKKHSFEALCSFSSNVAVLKVFGAKIAGYLGRQIMLNTTFIMSNVVGPLEEISFFGHPVAFIAPSVYGHPQALTIHLQGYTNKMVIVLAVDQSVIPHPHKLCEDFVKSFNLIKAAALGK